MNKPKYQIGNQNELCPRCQKLSVFYGNYQSYGKVYKCENCQILRSKGNELTNLYWCYQSSRLWEFWENKESNTSPYLVKTIIDRDVF